MSEFLRTVFWLSVAFGVFYVGVIVVASVP